MANVPEVSSFQISAAYHLAKKLQALVEVRFEPVFGESEFWIECNLSSEARVFLYNDGAEISGKDMDIRLEIYDFLNEDEMMHEFLNRIAAIIERK
ncbi:MAG: hypothetical protein ACR2RF_03455 [Geminicoccaceae bacterium]